MVIGWIPAVWVSYRYYIGEGIEYIFLYS